VSPLQERLISSFTPFSKKAKRDALLTIGQAY
jgi:hypothetical protein